MNCVYCGSGKTIRNGTTANRVQIYKCKNCNRAFREAIITEVGRPPIYDSMNCVYCRSTKTVKNGVVNEVQRYLCRSCGKQFRESIVTDVGRPPIYDDPPNVAGAERTRRCRAKKKHSK